MNPAHAKRVSVVRCCHNCEHLREDGSCKYDTFLPEDYRCNKFAPRRDLL